MSKTKTMPRPKSKPAQPTPEDARTIVLTLKGTPEYHQWLHQLAAHCRQTAVGVMDLALVSYARQVGFAVPPPRRNATRA